MQIEKFFSAVLCLFALVQLLVCCSPSTSDERDGKRPNVLLLLTDDLTFSAVQALGNATVNTPNMDRLVENGTTFSHAYNMGAWSGAVCVASRAMLITGRSLWDAHAYEQNQRDLVDRGEMWSLLMKKAGYRTYMSGKWHIQSDPVLLFDRVKDVRPGMPEDGFNRRKFIEAITSGNMSKMPLGYNRPLGSHDTAWVPWDKRLGGYWEGGVHWSEVLADNTIQFLNEAKADSTPFFMYIAFNAPHYQRQSPKAYVDRYPLDSIPLPKAYMPENPYRSDEIGLQLGQRDESLAPFPRTEFAIKTHLSEYYAIISHLDTQIGRILDALQASGEASHTYIIFTSDHGLAMGNHGLMGKQSLYDHSIRVPFVVVGPDVPKGAVIDANIYLQDAMATALDIGGVKKPDYLAFNSVLPFIRGERTASYYPAVYGGYRTHQRMIRKDGFKLIVYPNLGTSLLFDVNADPHELHDLSQDTSYRERKQALFDGLIDLQTELRDSLDLSAFNL